MTERLLLRIAGDDTLEWRAGSGARGAGAPPTAVVADAGEVVVLVPSVDVLLTEVSLPRANAARQAKVLPFALEDQLLDPVDELHFALGPALEGGRHAAAAVARERLAAWLAILGEVGVQTDLMMPDCLSLPLADAGASALIEGDQTLLRLGPCQGMACDTAQLRAWLAQRASLQHLVLYRSDNAALPALPETLIVDARPAASVFDILAQGAGTPPALNLLQGDYAPRHRRAPQRRLWRAVAALAVLAGLLALGTQVVSVLRLRAANQRVDADIAAVYAQAFPRQPVAPDPVARMRSELARVGGGTDHVGVLPLLARIAPILRQHGRQLTTLGMDYRNATLELAVRTPDLASLDQLREQLASLSGLHVELTAATPGERGVDGRLRIRGGGA